MNSWLRAITAVSAAVCVLSLAALFGLAVRTTNGKSADATVPEWQPVAKSADAGSDGASPLQVLSSLLPLIAEQGNQLVDRLTEINQTDGVVPNELVLTFKTPEALTAFRARAQGQGLEIISSDPRLLAARVGYNDAEAMSRELAKNASDYESVGPNYLIWVPGLPQEPQTD
ncbi:MAG TPA: hypothetical protein VD994_10610, partial [Prosthecobacter sp.]|nr:hypothetical protein [Prosthecobacter sp.]